MGINDRISCASCNKTLGMIWNTLETDEDIYVLCNICAKDKKLVVMEKNR